MKNDDLFAMRAPSTEDMPTIKRLAKRIAARGWIAVTFRIHEPVSSYVKNAVEPEVGELVSLLETFLEVEVFVLRNSWVPVVLVIRKPFEYVTGEDLKIVTIRVMSDSEIVSPEIIHRIQPHLERIRSCAIKLVWPKKDHGLGIGSSLPTTYEEAWQAWLWKKYPGRFLCKAIADEKQERVVLEIQPIRIL